MKIHKDTYRALLFEFQIQAKETNNQQMKIEKSELIQIVLHKIIYLHVNKKKNKYIPNATTHYTISCSVFFFTFTHT